MKCENCIHSEICKYKEMIDDTSNIDCPDYAEQTGNKFLVGCLIENNNEIKFLERKISDVYKSPIKRGFGKFMCECCKRYDEYDSYCEKYKIKSHNTIFAKIFI